MKRHGYEAGYNLFGCRCLACTAAHSACVRGVRERKLARLRTDPTSARHGIRATYDVGCRCQPCTEIRRVAHRAYSQRRKTGAS